LPFLIIGDIRDFSNHSYQRENEGLIVNEFGDPTRKTSTSSKKDPKGFPKPLGSFLTSVLFKLFTFGRNRGGLFVVDPETSSG
jgi:hypothetical protein